MGAIRTVQLERSEFDEMVRIQNSVASRQALSSRLAWLFAELKLEDCEQGAEIEDGAD